MKKAVLFFIIVLIWIGLPNMMWGQAYRVPIYVQFGPITDTLWLGEHTLATFGLDSPLGEVDLGPVPEEGTCDVRLVSPRGDSPSYPTGLKTDIRPYVEPCQTDTFKIVIQLCLEADSITFSWPNLAGAGCDIPFWRFTDDLGSTLTYDIDMLQQQSVTITNLNRFTTFYIRKSDGHQFRTFTMSTLAHDGTTDARGKKTYGAAVRNRSNMVEFCAEFVNNETTPVNGLRVEFKTPVEIATMTVTGFQTSMPYYGAYLSQKWDFMQGTINPGEKVTICGYGVKPGVREQEVKIWYWSKDGIVRGTRKRTATFTTNITRLPMPNTVNAGVEMMTQLYPGKADVLIVGSTDRQDSSKYVYHSKYVDILKTLIKSPGKLGLEKMHSRYPSYLNRYDHVRFGLRMGRGISRAVNTLSPDKHENRLLGEVLTLAVNLKFSETQKVPAGLGQLQINLRSSPFFGMTIDDLLAQANQYLTWGFVATDPSLTADDLVEMVSMVNNAFSGPIDTASWSGQAVRFNGIVSVGKVGWLYRNPYTLPRIIADRAATSSTEPQRYTLEQNYPNPFNPATTISFNLPNDGIVTLKVINLLGQEVTTLLQQTEYTAGMNRVEFDASSLASGVYFYRLQVNDPVNGGVVFQDIKKMVLLK